MTLRIASVSAVVRRVALPALLLVAGTVAACGDPFALKAQYENREFDFFVFPLSGTPSSYPSALAVAAMGTTRPDGSLSFDVAFDLNAAGDITLLPVKLVGVSTSGTRNVGIQKMTGTFESISEAPKTGYTIDSVTVVRVGQPVVLQVQSTICAASFQQNLYAKMVVDSIGADRRIWARSLISINCGFRQLVAGFPTF